jgi:hypothetical protein
MLQPSEWSGCAVMRHNRERKVLIMAILTSLQGQGGGRIPMGSFSYDVSRQDLAAIIESMPPETCRAMHIAARQGNLVIAQQMLREAAEQYFSTVPTAPAAAPVAPRHGIRRPQRTHTYRF